MLSVNMFELITSTLFVGNILAVRMRECLGKHSCMRTSFPIAILNGFPQRNYMCTRDVRDEIALYADDSVIFANIFIMLS